METEITLKYGWYHDQNGNKWNATFETEESVRKKSYSLINCSDCSGCSRCSDYKENPQRYTTPKIGARDSHTTIYWLDKNVQIICGCYRGNLDEFEARVKRVHEKTEHLQPYLKQIEIMKYLISQTNLKIQPMTDNHEKLITFAMWLTGHDRETIEQMYRDWSNPPNEKPQSHDK